MGRSSLDSKSPPPHLGTPNNINVIYTSFKGTVADNAGLSSFV